ncbi:MAG: elongation factor P [Caldiserica bacterium]|nr:MAG: elongation factor P [Caldisericota bacterium]
MISTSDFSRGMVIEVDGEYYEIIWFQHHKPGKGQAVVRTKLRNIKTGQVLERTFRSGETFNEVELERKKVSYLYNDGENYVFMDNETYEQYPISKDKLGNFVNFIKEGMDVFILQSKGELLGIDLPLKVKLKVVHTVPGVKGDSVSNVYKPATLETGAEIKVPLFINEGDYILVDTRTGEYIERVEE